jgi:hypothetical protein
MPGCDGGGEPQGGSSSGSIAQNFWPWRLERVAPADCWKWGKWGIMQGVHMKGVPSLIDLLGSSCRYKRFLAALVGPVQNMFFLTIHFFISLILIAQQAGQAVVPRRLSLNMGLCSWHTAGLSLKCRVREMVNPRCKSLPKVISQAIALLP